MSEARERAYARRRTRTRESIIDAAVEVFRSSGYEKVTADGIAEAAGCSRASFYVHFDSKSAVVIAAVEQFWSDQDSLSAHFRDDLVSRLGSDELSAVLADSVRSQSFPVSALHTATLTGTDVRDWYFREQDRAFGILLGESIDASSDRFARLRARFHLLGRMTPDALNPGSSGFPTDIDEASSFLGEPWANLLIEVSKARRSAQTSRAMHRADAQSGTQTCLRATRTVSAEQSLPARDRPPIPGCARDRRRSRHR